MNKVKMFFIAAALVLTTAGVFAAKSKFALTGTLYVYRGGVATAITPGNLSFPATLTTSALVTPLTIIDAASNNYSLYYLPTGGSYTAVTSSGW